MGIEQMGQISCPHPRQYPGTYVVSGLWSSALSLQILDRVDALTIHPLKLSEELVGV